MSENRDDFIIAIRYALLRKGTKQKFSLFFLILFSILIIFLDRLSISPLKGVRAILNDIVYRVTIVVSTPEKILVYLNSKAKEHINIYNEVQILKKEIEILKINKYDSLFLKTENENLKTTLGFQLNTTRGSFKKKVAAYVIIDQNSPYLKSLLI